MNSSQHQATPMINIGIYNLKTGKNIQPAVHENLDMRTRAHIYSHAHCMYAHMGTRAHIYSHACTYVPTRAHTQTAMHIACMHI